MQLVNLLCLCGFMGVMLLLFCLIHSTGLTFLESKNVSLPAGTFVSYDALSWMRNNCPQVHDFSDAAKVIQVLDYMLLYAMRMSYYKCEPHSLSFMIFNSTIILICSKKS